MSECLIFLYVWLFGWLILSIGYYIFKVYIEKDIYVNKKIHVWRAFKYGALSITGIVVVLVYLLAYLGILIDDKIEKYLKQ